MLDDESAPQFARMVATGELAHVQVLRGDTGRARRMLTESLAFATQNGVFGLETETTVAFRDINPQAPTHVLVIPKAHYRDVAALAAADPALAADILRETQAIAEEDKLESYRVVFNTGSGAGQTVWHAHAHVIGGRGLHWPPG